MDVEKIAAASIQNVLSRNSYLQPIVIYNDKTPVWDGDIFVYKTKDRNKKNENLIGRVPVQVKGHEVKQIKDTESGVIKFRVEIADIKQDYYIIENYFTKTYKVKYILSDTNKQTQISQFLALDKEMLLVDNIDAKNIMKDIKRHHSGNKKTEIVNNFLLEAIKANDECSIQQKELSALIYELSVWLYNETEEDYIFLNLAQVKYRLGILDENDLRKTKDISKLNEKNIEIQAATSILLNKKEEAKAIVNKMDMEEKEMFIRNIL